MCDCGNDTIVASSSLQLGKTQSCGCLQRERASKHLHAHHYRTHGKNRSRVYEAWKNILARCTNPSHPTFDIYGGRGIDVGFRSFLEFYSEIGDPPSPRHTIDRINNERGYWPGNVRWAIGIVQHNNKRVNHLVTYSGRTQTLAQWARELNIKYKTLFARIQRGWTVDRALAS